MRDRLIEHEPWSADPIASTGYNGYVTTRTEFAEHDVRVLQAWEHENSGSRRSNGTRREWLRMRGERAVRLAELYRAGRHAIETGRARGEAEFDAAIEYTRLSYQECRA
jgi:hypothetical protein